MTRSRIHSIALFLVVAFLSTTVAEAQPLGLSRDGHMWPASSSITSATGTVIVDHSSSESVFMLDTNGDGVGDIVLDFGPMWYTSPGGQSMPVDGDVITVTGRDARNGGMQGLDVLTINGDIWRKSNEYGMTGWNMGTGWSISGDLETRTGVLLADTSYFYHHYYLDSNDDGTPDYQLGLGPMWYTPASGYQLPVPGTSITVEGTVVGYSSLSMFMVQSIDGHVWRSLSEPPPWAGTWVLSSRTDSTFVLCATDTSSVITFPDSFSGMGMGMGARQWPDSAFVEFWGVHPDSMPGTPPTGSILGYYINILGTDKVSMMDGSWGGRIGMASLNREMTIRFHYPDDFVLPQGGPEGSMFPSWWNTSTNHWEKVSMFTLDEATNTVTFRSADIAEYYTLSTQSVATSMNDSPEMPEGYNLFQNYPNPFNPETVIEYQLPEASWVSIQIFDVTGRLVTEPVSGQMYAGVHRVLINASELTSGIYLYRIQAGTFSDTKTFTLIR